MGSHVPLRNQLGVLRYTSEHTMNNRQLQFYAGLLELIHGRCNKDIFR